MKTNMINTKLLIIVTLLGTSMFFASCKKYLDEQPVTALTNEKAFSTIDSAFQVLLGAYSQMAGDPGYGIRLNIYYPMGSDESMNPSENNDGGRRSISRYEVTAGNSELARPFKQIYVGIERSNICIDNIPNMSTFNSGSEAEQKATKRMYGEALTLRALYYLELIRLWGDVPATFVPASKQTQQFLPKENRDVIYERLLDDLAIAEENLPWQKEVAADERISKGAAKALRARIALYRGGYSLRPSTNKMERGSDHIKYYTIARDECKEIMESGQHALAPSFKELWQKYVCGVKTPVDPYGEIIFQVAMAGGSSIADSKMGYACGPRVNNQGNNFILILPTAFYAFDSIDVRRDVSVAPYNVAADGKTKIGVKLEELRDGKFRRDWITPAVDPTTNSQYFSVNWPLIRYSDVLLMYAEAENEISGAATPQAIAAFELVRKRGYAGNESKIGVTPTDKSGFFNALVKERLLEFMGEGVRKYDLIRWNLLGDKINETKANLAKLANHEAPYDQVPLFMYYYKTTTADNSSIWATSYYAPGPSGSNDIPNATRVNWSGTSTAGAESPIKTVTLARYAVGFTPNKSELFPLPTEVLTNGRLQNDYGY
jgi:hypothetical protein